MGRRLVLEYYIILFEKKQYLFEKKFEKIAIFLSFSVIFFISE